MSDFRSSASFKVARQVLRFVLPIILLAIIFSRIDLDKLIGNFREVNYIYLLGVLALIVLPQVLIGSFRWKILLQGLYGIDVPYLSLLRYMWIGMFVGYFVPGGIGIDIFRTYGAKKHGGGYKKNIATIIAEKIYAAIASILLLLVCYLIVRDRITAEPGIIELIRICFFAGSLLLLLGTASVIATRTGRGRILLSFIHRKFDSAIVKVMSRITGRDRNIMEEENITSTLIKPLFNWRIILLTVSITILLRILTGIGINILYRALGMELPILVNVFVSTLLFYLFILPVSFGSLGVREGGNILLYGLFGVEAETALTASFLSLACIMVGISVGGIIMLVDNATAGKNKADMELK
jgi:uncharacterized protein (TIRG00374 family)